MKFEALFVDSDVIIDYLKNKPEAIDFLGATQNLQIPCFCLLELIQGCSNKQEQTAMLKRLRAMPVYYPADEALRLAKDILLSKTFFKVFLPSYRN